MAASRWTATKAPSIRSARRRKARQAATAGPSGMSMTAKALSALIVCATRIAPTSMPDTRLGDLPEDVRVYLRPTGFIDAPFGHAGKAFRLAGGLPWFSASELITAQGDKRILSERDPVARLQTPP